MVTLHDKRFFHTPPVDDYLSAAAHTLWDLLEGPEV